MRVKYAARLMVDLAHYSIVHRSAGLLVVVLLLLAVGVLLVVSQAAVPFIYTVF